MHRASASGPPSTTTVREPAFRVIVVDDEAALRRAIGRVLQREGIEVIAVPSGHDALALLREGGVDAVLSDICMPQMSGIGLVRAMRASGLTVPVLLFSGMFSAEAAAEAARLGVFDLVAKPFENDTLIAQTHRAIAYGRTAPRHLESA